MRKIIFSLCFLFVAITMYAQQINGIRVESADTPIVVYINGQQMCNPAQSCFIANLKPGNYTIEVYATPSGSSHKHQQKGRKLYDERFYYRGRRVEEIHVEARSGNHSGGHDKQQVSVMNDLEFSNFMKEFRAKPFKSDRIKLLDIVMVTTDFNTEQCLKIVENYSFDDDKMTVMKKLYPQIVDKQHFYTVVEKLTFGSNKDNMNSFIKQYHDNDKSRH